MREEGERKERQREGATLDHVLTHTTFDAILTKAESNLPQDTEKDIFYSNMHYFLPG